MNVWFRWILAAACLAMAAVAPGCGEDWQASVHPASGRLAINGEPAAGALVQLIPTPGNKPDERNSRPWGLVREDGSFVLSTYDGSPGAPVGTYDLTITWPPDASKPSTVDRLKGRYASPDRAAARVEIKPGDNVLAPVELTGVTVDKKADDAPMAGPMQPTDPTKSVAKGKARR